VSDTVYVFTRRAGEEVLTALDGANGRERWHSGYPAAYTPSQPTVAHGSGPKATPLFLDGHIYTLGISGILSAFDVSIGQDALADTKARRAPLLQRGFVTRRRERPGVRIPVTMSR